MAIIPVHPADNLQTKINSAVAGDILELDAGGTWDGTFTLPAVGGVSALNPITIRSSDFASLPNGRVSPANTGSMARVRSISANPAFRAASNSSYWILDGLEITDNAGTASINALVELGLGFTGVSHMTVTRCYLHQKETETVTYERSAIRGIISESTYPTVTRCYIGPFIGYPYGHGTDWTPFQSNAFECEVTGSNILLEDNFLSAWYSTLFLGGADTAATHTATLSAGASTTSATFSDTTNLQASIAVNEFPIIQLQLRLTGTLSATTGDTATFTRTSGAALTSANIATNQGGLLRGGGVFQIQDAAPSRTAVLTAVSGDTYTLLWIGSSTHPVAGSYSVIDYQTVQATNVSGSVVTYTPFGTDQLTQAPSTASGAAAWSVLGESLISNITVRRNTIYIEPAFAIFQTQHSSNVSKGYWENKNCYNMTVEGNVFSGFPSLIAWTGTNQNGLAPWITVSHVIIRNNWFMPDLYPGYNINAIYWLENQYNTGTPCVDLQVYNNVFGPTLADFIKTQACSNVQVYHNTVLNDGPTYFGYSTCFITDGLTSVQTNGTYRDNIWGYQKLGFFNPSGGTFSGTWPPASNTWSNNATIDTRSDASGGFTTSTWGAGSILSPTNLTSMSQVGFTSLANKNYRLLSSSPYYQRGTSNTDPGVDWNTLVAALGFDPSGASSGSVTLTGQIVVSGPVTID